MHFLNKEKVDFALNAYISFLNIVKETDEQHVEEANGFIAKTAGLQQLLQDNKLEPINAAQQLNGFIEQVNTWLRAPYPQLASDTPETLVKGVIVAFEHYLNQELKAQHLSIQQEAPLFNDSLILWEKVGVSLSAKEGADGLVSLVQQLNSLLPKKEHYPLPDATQY